jgi:FAD binding domain/Berberine and berberine like
MTSAAISPTAVAELRAALRGPVVVPGDPTYDEVAPVHNAAITTRPQAIARCVDAADVMAAVTFGRGLDGVDVAVRGGGHNGAGLGTSDGLVIDLGLISGVRIDPAARLAYVGGGATVADLDHAAGAFGLATPAGIIGTTGIGGLTLGGGHGHLSRKYGLTIDNLVAADVVLADASFLTTDAGREPDLFWALRGGGGNFGIVTEFVLRLHPVGVVAAGPILYPIERTEEILQWYRELLPILPREMGAFFATMSVPPADPFPADLHLKKVCGVAWCWAGESGGADEHLAEARAMNPLLDGVAEMPYPVWNSAFDALYGPGDQWYWRGDFLREIPDEAVALHAEYGRRLPTWKSTMHLYSIDGAVHDVGPDETAWAYRDATYSEVIAGVDPDPVSLPALRDWCVSYWEAQHPYSAGGGYVNFMMNEGQDRVRATYGSHYDRLAVIKATYDPDNFFHVNQNIEPDRSITLPGPRVSAAQRQGAER